MAISSRFSDCEVVTDDSLGGPSLTRVRNAELAVDNQWDWETEDWLRVCVQSGKAETLTLSLPAV